jgi:LacI family transcriptional regulator
MWWSRLLAGVDQAIRETGGVAQVRLVTVDHQTPADVVAQCSNEGINALVNLGDHWCAVELLAFSRAARERRMPTVMAWTSQPQPLPIHLIELDNQIGIEEAVNHVVDLGHSRIGFLEFSETYAWVGEREQAFRVALAARGLTPVLKTAIRQRTPLEQSPELESVADGCTAVVCANDDLAAAMLKWARAHGRSVPEDLSIVGFDDDPLYRQYELTTVHDDMERLGREAVRLAAHLLESGDETMRLTLRLPARLVVRRTTGAPRSGSR